MDTAFIKNCCINPPKDTQNAKILEIKSGIEFIKSYAFAKAENLEEIYLPKSLKAINQSAFRGCTSLKKINLPLGLTIIGESALSTTGLEKIVVPSSVEEIGDFAFGNSIANEIIFLKSLPAQLNELGAYAFMKCKNIKKIDLSSSTLKKIEIGTFQYCESLEELILPDTVEYISADCFMGCTSLKSLTLPKDLKIIDATAFRGVNKNLVLNLTKEQSKRCNLPFKQNITDLTLEDIIDLNVPLREKNALIQKMNSEER